MTCRFLFVGERQSLLAAQQGWQWTDERVCAKTLFSALRAAGIEPEAQLFTNLWTTPGVGPCADHVDLTGVERGRTKRLTVVALGQLVHRELERQGIAHLTLAHPAARGAIRKRERYHAHVAAALKQEGA